MPLGADGKRIDQNYTGKNDNPSSIRPGNLDNRQVHNFDDCEDLVELDDFQESDPAVTY